MLAGGSCTARAPPRTRRAPDTDLSAFCLVWAAELTRDPIWATGRFSWVIFVARVELTLGPPASALIGLENPGPK
jgi:hypothetical protein